MRHARLLALAPLALALSALGVRELTRARARPEIRPVDAVEFTPPPLQLALADAPAVGATFRVDVEQSLALLVGATDGDVPEQRLQVHGSVRIEAEGSIAHLELELTPSAGADATSWPRAATLHVRGFSAVGSASLVPSVRSCPMRATVSTGRRSQEANLAITWMRLPGGVVELHAATRLDSRSFDLSSLDPMRMLRRPSHHWLGFDLVLRADG